jgi:hypothetical protein
MDTALLFNPAISICSPAPPATRFNIGACYNRTLGCSFFPNVPIDKCAEYCGSAFGYYELSDVFEALITWVIPLFALLANMHFAESTLSALGFHWPRALKNHSFEDHWLWNFIVSQLPKHFVCSVQLANPIGTIWSLAVKLDLGQHLWDHCYDRLDLSQLGLDNGREKEKARRDVANLCYCLDDFGHEKFESRVNRLFGLLDGAIPNQNGTIAQGVYKHIKETSHDLALVRIRNTRHTTFAVLVYVGAAVAALLASTTSSGLDYALPHTIALRELCFFVLAQVILSSAAGGWPQQWTPQATMLTFATRICKIEKSLGRDGECELWEDLAEQEIALWDGGSYVFRPQKIYSSPVDRDPSRGGQFSCGNGSWRHLLLLGMAWAMVISAFAVSFTISCLTPTTGIGGRGLAEILYIAVWAANFFGECLMTWWINDRKQLFRLIWLKDGIISLLVLLFFFLPFIGKPCSSAVMRSITFANLRPGWFNSCRSWSAWFSRYSNAYLDLNIAAMESWLAFRLYLSGVIVGSVVQVTMALFIVYLKRKAIDLSQRSSKENRELCEEVKSAEHDWKPRTRSKTI